ncbi:hypothetical protein JYU34_016545 [Plutella xylostella]|uniref:Uncharacterized protein n=1 Tax=Plutella xylostella TaxID=51655 RepID=A0ABQ7Q2W0_PLUXY|nr:hypothetical protein JYU34_016545 [Plutella xylostella]
MNLQIIKYTKCVSIMVKAWSQKETSRCTGCRIRAAAVERERGRERRLAPPPLHEDRRGRAGAGEGEAGVAGDDLPPSPPPSQPGRAGRPLEARPPSRRHLRV